MQAQRAKPSTATENRTPDKRATGEIVVHRESQTSKHPSFQTSTLPCTPGTSATCHNTTRRLSPLCTTALPSPRRGAPVSPASPESPEPGRGRVSAPSPKHGVRSPPCPYRPPGRTCALRARTARPCAACFVSFVAFVILRHTGSPAGGSSRPSLCSSVTLREPLCSSVIGGFLLRVPLWFFVPLRVSPAGQTFHILPALHPSRACRALSVLRSPFSVLHFVRAPRRL